MLLVAPVVEGGKASGSEEQSRQGYCLTPGCYEAWFVARHPSEGCQWQLRHAVDRRSWTVVARSPICPRCRMTLLVTSSGL